MITTIKALIDVKEAVSQILKQAGFGDGNVKIIDDKPMFWFVNVPNIEGSEKEIYLTYNINSITPAFFGDGKPCLRKVIIDITLFCRDDDKAYNHLTNLNNAFVLRGWAFELNRINFDSVNQLYVYSFLTHCEVG